MLQRDFHSPLCIVPYGGNFHAMNEFWRTGLGTLVDGRLDLRCALYGYQYSDIMLARRRTSTPWPDGGTTGPYTTPATNEPNVLEGLSFLTLNGGKGALCAHISQHRAKNQPEHGKISFLAVLTTTL